MAYLLRLDTQWLPIVFAAVLLMLAGCHEIMDLPAWVPGGGPVTDDLPGIVTPGQRMARLRKLAEESSWRNAADRQIIARDLAAAYEEETDEVLRAEIVRTMSKYPGPEAEQVLRKAIQDAAAEVRLAACDGLGKLGNPEAAALLIDALESDVEVDVRLAAARALGKCRNPAAVPALGRALDDPDPAMQHRAMLALREVTGEDLGNDLNRWRQYVKGQPPKPAQPLSIAEKLRRIF